MTRVGVIGAGEIGSGWAALFAASSFEVRVFDPDPAARDRVERAVAGAERIGLPADAARVTFTSTLGDAADDATWIQESVPEELELKRRVLSQAAESPGRAIIASSTSSFTARELCEGGAFADRFVIAHPLHPVYAVPVVELSAADATPRALVERASEFLRSAGREPIILRGDPRGLVSNRLTAALLREALELVSSGAIAAEELDHLVSRGIATGWMAAGIFGTERLGGGDANGAAAAARVQHQLAPLLDSLAGWTELSARHREVLERVLSSSGDEADRASDWPLLIARLLGSHRPAP